MTVPPGAKGIPAAFSAAPGGGSTSEAVVRPVNVFADVAYLRQNFSSN
jgi:hypothetical protein